jgi:hypothetical protein
MQVEVIRIGSTPTSRSASDVLTSMGEKALGCHNITGIMVCS